MQSPYYLRSRLRCSSVNFHSIMLSPKRHFIIIQRTRQACLLESLGYNVSMICLDESAGLDEGLESNEEIDDSENGDEDVDG